MDYVYLASTCHSISTVLAVFAMTSFGINMLSGELFDTTTLMFQITKSLLGLTFIALLWYLVFTYSIQSHLFAELCWIASAVSIGLLIWVIWGFVRIFRD